CQVPLAAYAEIDDGTLTLRALVASPDGTRTLRADRSGPVDQAQAIGEAVAAELFDAGAQAILDELLQDASPED
ncbi:hydroxymethylbilane synthase, partial [Campylobacter coli]|nr:hydroxymethylbilane synthase [Campylobacter coli]